MMQLPLALMLSQRLADTRAQDPHRGRCLFANAPIAADTLVSLYGGVIRLHSRYSLSLAAAPCSSLC